MAEASREAVFVGQNLAGLCRANYRPPTTAQASQRKTLKVQFCIKTFVVLAVAYMVRCVFSVYFLDAAEAERRRRAA